MTTKEIKELIKLVNELDLAEVKIVNKEFELKIRTTKDVKVQAISGSAPVMAAAAPQVVPVGAVPQDSPQAPPSAKDEEGAGDSSYIEIKSPMVGTFYRSSGPDKPPFVQVGDTISQGSVVCIIEAMKLFNEIESEVAGKIVKVMIDDSTPVEYDQVLFLVDPAG